MKREAYRKAEPSTTQTVPCGPTACSAQRWGNWWVGCGFGYAQLAHVESHERSKEREAR